MAYTGNKIQPTLKKVTNDSNEYPLDINDELCSVSGLPQDTMPNPNYDPSYRVPDDACEPVIYYSKALFDYFTKECPEDEEGSLVSFEVEDGYFTSPVSQADADNKAMDYFLSQGQANANLTGTCGTTTCNTSETRTYYSNTCGSLIAKPYYVTLAANTFCGTSDEIETAVNNWFDINGQSQADYYGECDTGDYDSLVYKTSGDPCTSTRTATRIYFKASDGKYYIDEERTILANLYYFPNDTILQGFKQIIDGVLQEVQFTYEQCNVAPETPIYYQDMGTPADISICGNDMLACYPLQHVVVKYNLSTGTNPTGVIVAGELNIPQTSPSTKFSSNAHLLNSPTLVEWEDGLVGTAGERRFCVYSGGTFKSIKTFFGTGDFIKSNNMSNEETPNDAEWAYNEPSEGDPYNTPSSTTSLVGLLTQQSSDLNNFWIPVSISFTNDVIFIGMWNKTTASVNRFKIYAIVLYSWDENIMSSKTQLVRDDPGVFTLPNKADLIRAMKVIACAYSGTSQFDYGIAVVTPYVPSKGSANNRMRYWDMHMLKVSVMVADDYGIEPVITAISFAFYNSYRHNSNTSGVWKNNLKAEINFCNGTFTVTIKSSADSLWNILLRSVAVPAAGAFTATMLIMAGLLTSGCAPCALIHGSFALLGLTGIGVAVVAAILLAIIIFAPPPQRYIGTSALTLTFSGVDIASASYTPGSYTAQTWINNSIIVPRTVHLSACCEALDTYSLYSGRVIKKGNWNSNNATGTVTN